MKKVKSFVIIFTLLIIKVGTNYATVTGNYTVSKAKSNGKMLFLLIGFVLISMVLFLGYKMDKLEETNNRKKKFNKIGKSEGLKNFISNIISKINTKEEKEKEEPFVYDELLNKEEKQEGSISGNRDIIEYDEDDLKSIDEPEIKENETDTSALEEILEEPKIQNQELDMISSIFNTDDINMKVKGYDFDSEDDIDLLDIEASIKEANIKRYTRKKEKKATKNATKHYTRKIEKNVDVEENVVKIEESKEKKPKKYTRKIKNEELENNNEDNNIENLNIESDDSSDDMDFLSKIIDLGVLDEIEDLEEKTVNNENAKDSENETKKEEPKTKRGRKAKKEVVDNKENKIAKSKRGRKPKEDKNKVSKKDDKSKDKKAKTKSQEKTKKDDVKSKRGRKPKVITEEEELRQAIEMLPKSRRGRKAQK